MRHVISFEHWNIYHIGNTLTFPGVVKRILPFRVDLALIPINGYLPSRSVAGILSISDAIELSQQISGHWLLPCHYELFTFITANLNEFAADVSAAGVQYCVLEPEEGKVSGKKLNAEN